MIVSSTLVSSFLLLALPCLLTYLLN